MAEITSGISPEIAEIRRLVGELQNGLNVQEVMSGITSILEMTDNSELKTKLEDILTEASNSGSGLTTLKSDLEALIGEPGTGETVSSIAIAGRDASIAAQTAVQDAATGTAAIKGGIDSLDAKVGDVSTLTSTTKSVSGGIQSVLDQLAVLDSALSNTANNIRFKVSTATEIEVPETGQVKSRIYLAALDPQGKPSTAMANLPKIYEASLGGSDMTGSFLSISTSNASRDMEKYQGQEGLFAIDYVVPTGHEVGQLHFVISLSEQDPANPGNFDTYAIPHSINIVDKIRNQQLNSIETAVVTSIPNSVTSVKDDIGVISAFQNGSGATLFNLLSDIAGSNTGLEFDTNSDSLHQIRIAVENVQSSLNQVDVDNDAIANAVVTCAITADVGAPSIGAAIDTIKTNVAQLGTTLSTLMGSGFDAAIASNEAIANKLAEIYNLTDSTDTTVTSIQSTVEEIKTVVDTLSADLGSSGSGDPNDTLSAKIADLQLKSVEIKNVVDSNSTQIGSIVNALATQDGNISDVKGVVDANASKIGTPENLDANNILPETLASNTKHIYNKVVANSGSLDSLMNTLLSMDASPKLFSVTSATTTALKQNESAVLAIPLDSNRALIKSLKVNCQSTTCKNYTVSICETGAATGSIFQVKKLSYGEPLDFINLDIPYLNKDTTGGSIPPKELYVKIDVVTTDNPATDAVNFTVAVRGVLGFSKNS